MEHWTPIIDAETVPASKYNDDSARLNREIESLRCLVEDLTNYGESLIHKIVVVKQTADEYKRKYQILRDNLSHEGFAELCELWPELRD